MPLSGQVYIGVFDKIQQLLFRLGHLLLEVGLLLAEPLNPALRGLHAPLPFFVDKSLRRLLHDLRRPPLSLGPVCQLDQVRAGYHLCIEPAQEKFGIVRALVRFRLYSCQSGPEPFFGGVQHAGLRSRKSQLMVRRDVQLLDNAPGKIRALKQTPVGAQHPFALQPALRPFLVALRTGFALHPKHDDQTITPPATRAASRKKIAIHLCR